MMIYELLANTKDYSETEKAIASFLIINSERIENMSARDIAAEVYTAASTVSRFAQKLGFKGFNELKKAYIEENKYLNSHFDKIDPNFPFLESDSDFTIAGKINSLYQETIADTASLIEYQTLEQCARMVNNARNIHITSSGTYSELAILFKEKMSRLGKTVVTYTHIDIAYYYSAFARKDDCFILISYSGETRDTLKVANRLKDSGVPFIILTSFGSNTLSKYSENIMYLSTREHIRGSVGYFGPYISTMFLLDVLYSCCFKHNYQKNLSSKRAVEKKFQVTRNSSNPILSVNSEE